MTQEDKFSFITISNISWEKGLTDFLQIAKEIRKSFPTDKFVWIGTGQVPEKYQSQTIVQFTGFLSENDKNIFLCKERNIFILCSYFEGFSVPIAEACLFKIPVVCYRIPEITSVYEDHIEYVKCFDTKRFVKKLTKIRKNYYLFKEKAKEARRFVIENYSDSAFLKRVESIIEMDQLQV